MANSTLNLLGGMLQGFAGTKNQAQQTAMMNDYRKAQTDMIKLEAKKQEAALKMQEIQAPIYEAIAKAASGQGGGGIGGPMPQQALPAGQPFAQFQPQIPQQQKQSLPDTIAQGQMPMGGGLVKMSPAGQKSTKFNNPYNVEFANWQAPYGATLGRDNRFGQYPSPEAGVASATDLIQKYAAQGHTLASAIEKFAPTSENPNTPQRILETAKILGVSPNTPLANVPLGPFMATHVKYESPTQINPAIFGQAANMPIGQTLGTNPVLQTLAQQPQAPMQQSQTPQLTQFNPNQQQGITGQKLLEGFLKKNFGVEPDDAKVVPYGDHKLVTAKNGNPLFIIAGQGKMEMVDIKQPDGSVIRKPQLIPPSPLPGGIPVYNLPGQAGGGMVGPGGLQTAPPEISYDEITQPGGGKVKIPVPKAQIGMTGYQTEPPKGQNASEAGRIQLAQSGLLAHQQLENMIFDPKTGKSKWGPLATGIGGGLPWTEGRNIESLIFRACDAIIRAATGAALNREELTNYARTYAPSVFDNEATVQSKMQGLRSFLNGYLEKMDPTEAARLRMGPIVGDMGKGNFAAKTLQSPQGQSAPQTAPLTPKNAPPPGSELVGTSNGKRVYKTPSGQGWME